jgi:hypothetical protein
LSGGGNTISRFARSRVDRPQNWRDGGGIKSGLLTAALVALPVQAMPEEAVAQSLAAATMPVANVLAQCATIAEDRARLACYDAAAGRLAAPAAASQTDAPVSVSEASALADTPQPASAAAEDSPGRFRFALSFGYGVGDYAGRFKSLGGTVNSDSAIGSAGTTELAEGWFDRWPGRDWSVGLAYLQFRNRGRADLTLPNGFNILTNPITAQTQVDASARLGFIEAAWRPQSSGPLQPFIGGGIGGGYGRASGGGELESAFLGAHAGGSTASSGIPAVEGLFGADIPFYQHFYLTLGPRIIWATAHPFGHDQRYLDIILSAGLGFGS